MIKLKGKQLSPAQQHYQEFAQARQPQTPVLTNSIKAFVTGGTICTIGQGIQWFFMNFYNFDEKTAGNPTVAVLIILSVVLTSMGIYDHIAQWGGAGSAVPVTGFANTIASASLDHKSEGFVLGVGANMFKIAGPVIVFGVFAAFVVGIVSEIVKAVVGG